MPVISLRSRWVAIGACLALLGGPAAFAQGGGAAGSQGQAGQRAQAPATNQWQGNLNLNDDRRARIEQQQQAAGVDMPPAREREQLRDLNAISRQLTPPGTPVPAPHVEPAPQGR